jgi:hypothetical protein
MFDLMFRMIYDRLNFWDWKMEFLEKIGVLSFRMHSLNVGRFNLGLENEITRVESWSSVF